MWEFVDFLDVEQILVATDRLFILDQFRPPQTRNLQITEFDIDMTSLSFIKIDAGYGSYQIDPNRLDTDLKYGSESSEVLYGQVLQRGAERLERPQGFFGIGWGGTDQNIQIAGRTGVAVGCHGMGPDHQKFSTGIVSPSRDREGAVFRHLRINRYQYQKFTARCG